MTDIGLALLLIFWGLTLVALIYLMALDAKLRHERAAMDRRVRDLERLHLLPPILGYTWRAERISTARWVRRKGGDR